MAQNYSQNSAGVNLEAVALESRLGGMSTDGFTGESWAFYRRLKARLGPAQAQVATAHKACPERSRRIARIVYHLLKFKVEYRHSSAAEYEQQFRARELRHLQRKAAPLGFALAPVGAVS